MQDYRFQSTLYNKSALNDRIAVLQEKITNLKLGNESAAEKKIESLQRNLEELQDTFQQGKNHFQQDCFDLNQMLAKIQKQLNYDYQATDRLVKDQIRNCETNFIEIKEDHLEQRRIHDAKIAKFIDDRCISLREAIDKQSKIRQSKAEQIEGSLSSDLTEIRQKLEQQRQQSTQTLCTIQSEFKTQLSKIRRDYESQCQLQNDSENQFYKMLRDLLKKVKTEIEEDKEKRQATEESILGLIEKMCDKAMQQTN